VKKNIIAPVALVAAGLLLLSACATEAEEAAPVADETAATETTEAASELSGTVLLDGSSTVGPFAEAAAELFMEVNPGVAVTVGISGTGGGFEKFCNGETDGSNASRDIKDEESALCADNGIAFGRVTVANVTLATWHPKRLFCTVPELTPEPSTSLPMRSTVRVETSAPTTTTSVRTTTRLFRVSLVEWVPWHSSPTPSTRSTPTP